MLPTQTLMNFIEIYDIDQHELVFTCEVEGEKAWFST